jgi:hypothetical protein
VPYSNGSFKQTGIGIKPTLEIKRPREQSAAGKRPANGEETIEALI